MPTRATVQSSCAFASLTPLDRAIQRELAALAALEADHCSACRWLEAWSGPKEVKEHLIGRLEARHRGQREPHVLRLAELHQQQAMVTTFAPFVDMVGSLRAGANVGAAPV